MELKLFTFRKTNTTTERGESPVIEETIYCGECKKKHATYLKELCEECYREFVDIKE